MRPMLHVEDTVMLHGKLKPHPLQKILDKFLSQILPEKSVTKWGKHRGSLSFLMVANHIDL